MEVSADNLSHNEDTDDNPNVVFNPNNISHISMDSVTHIDEGSIPTNYEKLDTKIKVRCCQCGLMIEPNPSNTCVNCLSLAFDISEGIDQELEIHQCRTCGRWDGPPWMELERESSKMLTMLLKKLKGITKQIKITDARFIYTEPHSKRMMIMITINKEVADNTILTKPVKIVFIERNKQCDSCRKSFTPHTWQAVVQVRQKVPHKRTFLFLEQLIIKHNAHEKCIKIEESDEGLNFYFSHCPSAMNLVEFIQSHVVIKIKQSTKLVSMNEKWNHCNKKLTVGIEI